MPRTYGTTNAAPYAAAPVVGPVGDTYYNTATKQLNLSDGTQWNPITGGAGGGPYSFAWTQTLTAPTVVSSPYTVTHNLNTTTPLVQVWDASTGLMVQTQVTVVNVNTIQISVAQNMPNNANVVVLGSANSPIPIAPGDYATKAYVDARTPNLPAPVTSGSGIQSFTDVLGDVWVAANGVYGGAWKRARDVLHCRVARAAAYTFPATTAALLNHDQSVRDTYNLYSAGYFTAPIPGLYLVGGKAAFTAAALGNTCNTQLAVNGSLWAYLCGVIAPAAGGVHMPYGSPLVPIVAGDTLSVSVLAFSGGPLNGIVGNSQTYLNIDYMGTG